MEGQTTKPGIGGLNASGKVHIRSEEHNTSTPDLKKSSILNTLLTNAVIKAKEYYYQKTDSGLETTPKLYLPETKEKVEQFFNADFDEDILESYSYNAEAALYINMSYLTLELYKELMKDLPDVFPYKSIMAGIYNNIYNTEKEREVSGERWFALGSLLYQYGDKLKEIAVPTLTPNSKKIEEIIEKDMSIGEMYDQSIAIDDQSLKEAYKIIVAKSVKLYPELEVVAISDLDTLSRVLAPKLEGILGPIILQYLSKSIDRSVKFSVFLMTSLADALLDAYSTTFELDEEEGGKGSITLSGTPLLSIIANARRENVLSHKLIGSFFALVETWTNATAQPNIKRARTNNGSAYT
ncbi:MAG: hypothetical protein ACP5UH_02505 [Candidatus Micrarchaeia archaeon]